MQAILSSISGISSKPPQGSICPAALYPQVSGCSCTLPSLQLPPRTSTPSSPPGEEANTSSLRSSSRFPPAGLRQHLLPRDFGLYPGLVFSGLASLSFPNSLHPCSHLGWPFPFQLAPGVPGAFLPPKCRILGSSHSSHVQLSRSQYTPLPPTTKQRPPGQLPPLPTGRTLNWVSMVRAKVRASLHWQPPSSQSAAPSVEETMPELR